MLYSTFLATAATAMLASASPLKARTDNAFSVSNFSYGCSPGGCAYSFDVSAPANGDNFPTFSNIYCNGTGYDTPYVPCGAISDTQSLGGWVNGTVSGISLILKYEVLDGEERFDYYGQAAVESTGHCPTCPTEYTVPVVSATAVT